MDQTILVTGAAGMLPSYMVDVLLNMRQELGFGPRLVLGLVRSLDKAYSRFIQHIGRADFRLIAGDVSAPPPFDCSIDYIIHAASQASPRFYGVDPAGTISANVLGTYHLLETARKMRSKGFLFFSSGEIYGETGPDLIPTREDMYGYLDPMNIRSCYAEGKRAGETLCVSWAHQYGVPARIVRPFHAYGPGMSLDDGRVFADFVANILAHRNIVLKSDGRASRPFCYIADATEGFFTILLKGKDKTAYNIAAEHDVSIRDLAHILIKEFHEREISLILQEGDRGDAYVPSRVHRACPDISRARALGWVPRTGLAEGFRRTVRSFEEASESEASAI